MPTILGNPMICIDNDLRTVYVRIPLKIFIKMNYLISRFRNRTFSNSTLTFVILKVGNLANLGENMAPFMYKELFQNRLAGHPNNYWLDPKLLSKSGNTQTNIFCRQIASIYIHASKSLAPCVESEDTRHGYDL